MVDTCSFLGIKFFPSLAIFCPSTYLNIHNICSSLLQLMTQIFNNAKIFLYVNAHEAACLSWQLCCYHYSRNTVFWLDPFTFLKFQSNKNRKHTKSIGFLHLNFVAYCFTDHKKTCLWKTISYCKMFSQWNGKTSVKRKHVLGRSGSGAIRFTTCTAK